MDRENPSFFKVLIGDFSDQLQIPPDFVKQFIKVLPYKSILCSSAQRFWRVNVEKIGNDVYFEKGWMEFVQDNALELGDFLVFSYDGDLKFDVKLYGKHGCEKKVAMATGKIYKSISCNGHEEKENAMRGKIWSGKRGHEEEREENVGHQGLKKSAHVRGANQAKRNESEIIYIDSDSDDETGIPTLHGQIKSEKLKLFQETSKIEPGKSKQSSCKESRGGKVTQRHSFSCVVETSEQGALKAASKFVSSHPSFTAVMKSAYLHNGYMHVPASFLQMNIKKSVETVKLKVSNEFWPVNLIRRERYNRFSGGWHGFVKDNSLHVGDVCVFELINSTDVLLKVHIFRCSI